MLRFRAEDIAGRLLTACDTAPDIHLFGLLVRQLLLSWSTSIPAVTCSQHLLYLRAVELAGPLLTAYDTPTDIHLVWSSYQTGADIMINKHGSDICQASGEKS